MSDILLIEDEEQVRVLAVSLVEELGHIGYSASNVDDALALLNTDQSFDRFFTYFAGARSSGVPGQLKSTVLSWKTPTEARQAEAGPSVLLLLVISSCLAVLGWVWFLFRT